MSGGSSRNREYSEVNISKRLSSSNETVGASQIDMEINKFLEELLKNINARDVESIRIHLAEIEKILGKNIDGLESILFGGSVSKSTFVEGMSDVDALVIFDLKAAKGYSPRELQDMFYDMLSQRFPSTIIEKGTLAVTVKFKDYDVQLLPTIRENDQIRIASASGENWSPLINTKAFTSKLTTINQVHNKKVIPVIKLAKNLLSSLPEKYKLTGYHIEALAVDAFSEYNGRYTLFDMTKHFLTTIENKILTPMLDRTGQSGVIDKDFGPERSFDRQFASKQIKAINGKFSNASSVDVTKTLFDL